jgi:hypothetical protein
MQLLSIQAFHWKVTPSGSSQRKRKEAKAGREQK